MLPAVLPLDSRLAGSVRPVPGCVEDGVVCEGAGWWWIVRVEGGQEEKCVTK